MFTKNSDMFIFLFFFSHHSNIKLGESIGKRKYDEMGGKKRLKKEAIMINAFYGLNQEKRDASFICIYILV